ncbi:EcsC family protein [Leptolyngbya sp. AS-A5]|uniref:EcsC family protein n=1 Tax=Leptolyngbya sp. AS-A5 TaxID=2933919 RepID=UPI001F54E35D|nr:EcsC family protein [Leptolyngbya sp. FACHB-17]
MILLCLLGESAKSVLRTAGVQIGNKAFKSVISQIPGKVLIEINKKIGFRPITKAGEKGVINLMKLVPIAGGVVGAGFDGWFVNTCGQTAKDIFKP